MSDYSPRMGRHRRAARRRGPVIRQPPRPAEARPRASRLAESRARASGLAEIRRRTRYEPHRITEIGRNLVVALVVTAALATVAAVVLSTRPHGSAHSRSAAPATTPSTDPPRKPLKYLGVFTPPSPASYAGVTAFTAHTGVSPGVVSYYSGWGEPFQTSFAATAVRHHAVPLVQIDPTNVSLQAIAAGQYDGYLRSYAAAVKDFGARVIISFGHEMNGNWYSWARTHTSPAVFVAAWRHIVDVFRQQGAGNVTWLWTVNVIDKDAAVPSPARWWPGSSYVNWVGIDGYYYQPSWTFASLFGPTIKAVRRLTLDPILIAETSVAPAAGQAAKIADLFAGVRAYGLLGFLWFDASGKRDWRLRSRAAFEAFGRAAKAAEGPAL
jgi:mannan endo-1,4-beta-mannosidase